MHAFIVLCVISVFYDRADRMDRAANGQEAEIHVVEYASNFVEVLPNLRYVLGLGVGSVISGISWKCSGSRLNSGIFRKKRFRSRFVHFSETHSGWDSVHEHPNPTVVCAPSYMSRIFKIRFFNC